MANWLIDKLNDVAKTYSEYNALVNERQEIKYKDFICYVAGLAEKLTFMGVRKGDVCAVLCDRNVSTIIAIFAIWAVGGIYLPIDVENPDNRNDYVIKQSQAKVIVNTCTTYDCKMNFMNRHSSEMVMPDFRKAEIDSTKIADILETDISYVLFTSGTTGKPKGVKINYGNIRNLFWGLVDSIYSKFEDHLNVALIAPFSFDASIQQIIPSLLLGHTLHITQNEQRKNPKKLIDFLLKHTINIFDCTPTHLKMLNGILMKKSIDNHSIKCIIIGGESLKGETAKAFAEKFVSRSPFFVNIYGVTECTVDSVYNFFDPNNVEYSNSVPIGIPMKGVNIAIVDEYGQSVAQGEQGEILIGGQGVGSGYWEANLNKKYFVNLEAFPNVSFYKTGDLAKVDQDGQIVCLGRNDRQVKVRGNRIELDEIEACIMRINNRQTKKVVCNSCLLDNYSTTIGLDGICDVCRNYEKNAEQIRTVFGSLDDFRKLMEKAITSKSSKYDCMLLYSGGKDSTYVLIQLIEMGYKVLAYTFDNGYLSEQTFNNINKITKALSVESVIETFPKMDDVFSESIQKYHTVCDGCYKVLVTLSTKYAMKHGITAIVTGLDRGQIIETKLKGLLKQGIISNIEQYLFEQRKVYHYWNNDFDLIQDIPGNSKEMDKISFLDYFFYDDINETKVLEQLKQSGIWKRSYDTGLCSTNCRMNDVGIFAFYKAKGYHNYAAPLSWEIRLKQITREEGLAKILVEHLDYKYINETLTHLGVNAEVQIRNCRVVMVDNRLIAFLDCSGDVDITKIQTYLKQELPSYMMPYRFIVLRGFPITESGKIDNLALLAFANEKVSNYDSLKMDDPILVSLINIWEKILGHSDFGVDDSFFDIGGDSLDAVLMSEEIQTYFGCSIPFEDMLEKFTINGISNQIKKNKSS